MINTHHTKEVENSFGKKKSNLVLPVCGREFFVIMNYTFNIAIFDKIRILQEKEDLDRSELKEINRSSWKCYHK